MRSLVTVLSMLCSSAALAGPLTPPVGPIAPTPGPEPRIAVNAANTPGDADATPSLFKITQPGSYYLAGNITGIAGRHGIEIASSGVTLDLNGFDVVGVAGSLDGVVVTPLNLVNICVRNGSIRSWGQAGINLLDGATSATNITDIVASANTGVGIRMGFGGVITRCTAYNNTAGGIGGAAGTVITECVAYTNGGDGISTASGCTVSRCTVRSNVGDGIDVFNDCLVIDNDCSLNGNGAGNGAGIRITGNDCRVEGNNCTDADRGIEAVVAGNVIVRNTCSGNTTNWVIAANNVVGPILDRTAPASAAISGNSAPSSLGSTDPNANFTY